MINFLIVGSFYAKAQQSYSSLIFLADSLYKAKNYQDANKNYISGFKLEHKNKIDLYNAGCAAALAGDQVTALKFLNLSVKQGWIDIDHLKKDSDLVSLHDLAGWKQVVSILQAKIDQMEASYNKEAKVALEEAYQTDQDIRIEFIAIRKKESNQSKKADSLYKLMIYHDSLNTITVTKILDKYGWLGEDKVGNKGNLTLFLVVQHASLETQQKYLPMLRMAAKKGRARLSSLALLEDRVALGEGKKQIYGSQLSSIPNNPNKYYLAPLLDPNNVDKRRAAMGMQPLADYIKAWDILWDIEEYKKQLPQYEEWAKGVKK